MTNNQLIAAAYNHWAAECSNSRAPNPSQSLSSVEGGIVTLANVNGTLARFRFDFDGEDRPRFTAIDVDDAEIIDAARKYWVAECGPCRYRSEVDVDVVTLANSNGTLARLQFNFDDDDRPRFTAFRAGRAVAQ